MPHLKIHTLSGQWAWAVNVMQKCSGIMQGDQTWLPAAVPSFYPRLAAMQHRSGRDTGGEDGRAKGMPLATRRRHRSVEEGRRKGRAETGAELAERANGQLL